MRKRILLVTLLVTVVGILLMAVFFSEIYYRVSVSETERRLQTYIAKFDPSAALGDERARALSEELFGTRVTFLLKDGTAVTGSDSVAKDRETVERNTNGALDAVARLNPDFMFFQEVDEDGDRSHHFNQVQAVKDKFRTDGVVYAENFHTAYLFYPLNKPHGKNNAGIVTVTSKYASSAVRRSFPVDNGFINKFFDLDRCFSITYLPVEGSDNYLCLVNVHMSAYDKGGVIRQQQLQLLNEVLTAEVEAGNYVVAGGDFNHDIAGSDGLFPTEMERPEWVYSLGDDDLDTKGVNYTVVLDGFIVSDNVEAVGVTNIDLDFEFSDHNPVMMTFRLK